MERDRPLRQANVTPDRLVCVVRMGRGGRNIPPTVSRVAETPVKRSAVHWLVVAFLVEAMQQVVVAAASLGIRYAKVVIHR